MAMVFGHLMNLEDGSVDASIRNVLAKVPRHEFVPEAQKARAYEDCALPIGYGQTISQPYIVGVMTQQLAPRQSDRVLEIGTGSGYQTAILAEVVAEVYTIEIVGALAKRSSAVLRRLGYHNVFTRYGDGFQGWPDAAPFDSIIVTCAPERVPEPLVRQLKDGGRMVIPVGPAGDQRLWLLAKERGQLREQSVLSVRFVPMTGESQTRSG